MQCRFIGPSESRNSRLDCTTDNASPLTKVISIHVLQAEVFPEDESKDEPEEIIWLYSPMSSVKNVIKESTDLVLIDLEAGTYCGKLSELLQHFLKVDVNSAKKIVQWEKRGQGGIDISIRLRKSHRVCQKWMSESLYTGQDVARQVRNKAKDHFLDHGLQLEDWGTIYAGLIRRGISK